MAELHHLAIHVQDLLKMERFYCELFNLPVLKRWPSATGGWRSVWLELKPGFLALEQAAFEPPKNEPFEAEVGGLLLLGIRIERAERAFWELRLAERGLAIEKRTPFSLFFRDPEGNRLAVSHHPDAVEDAA